MPVPATPSTHTPPPPQPRPPPLAPQPLARAPAPHTPPASRPRERTGEGRDAPERAERGGGGGRTWGGGVERRPARATPPTSGGTSGGGRGSAPERRGRGGTRAAADGAPWRPESARSGPRVGDRGDTDLAETVPCAKMLVDSARAQGLERWRPREGLETWRRENPSLGRLSGQSQGHGGQREKRNKCCFKGLNRDALSRGRHEGEDRPYGEGSFCRCPEDAGRWASRRTRCFLSGGRPEKPPRPRRPHNVAGGSWPLSRPGRGPAADWLRRRAEVMLLSPASRAPAEPRVSAGGRRRRPGR